EVVLTLPLVNIKVLSRDMQADATATVSPPDGGAGVPHGLVAGGPPPGMPGSDTPHAHAGESEGGGFDLNTLLAGTASHVPPAEAAEPPMDPAALLANPAAVDTAGWDRLAGMIDRVPAPARRLLMANLTRWLREQEARGAGPPASPPGLDHLLIERMHTETDLIALRETALTAEKRLEQLMLGRAWDEMIALLEPIRARLARDRSTDVQRQLGGVLDRIGEGTALRGLIDQSVQSPGSLDRVRRVVVLLGERAMRPLVNALKQTTAMQERVRVMQLLREFGDIQQPLLLDELRAPNAWYVYRNLLQVLEEIGTPDALAAIADKLHHDDARVRAEAISAAVRIAKDQATSYLLTGMQDADADVRARSLSLVGFCPSPRVLEQVLRLLMPPRLGKDEPDGVQLAAVLALGQFDAEEAFRALAEIIHPRLFSPFRRKSEEVRSAAVSALANHLDRPGVVAVLQAALRDRAIPIRQTAQRIWQQYVREGGTPTG
ncbi:MAG TPA: HEAT repeat domain-containing protein, partial [Armatimonadota bacterium]|nr:HEAT repeat domain-containing protein [Armatimonadota bacterium]